MDDLIAAAEDGDAGAVAVTVAAAAVAGGCLSVAAAVDVLLIHWFLLFDFSETCGSNRRCGSFQEDPVRTGSYGPEVRTCGPNGHGDSEGGEMVKDSLWSEGGGFHFFHFFVTFSFLRSCFLFKGLNKMTNQYRKVTPKIAQNRVSSSKKGLSEYASKLGRIFDTSKGAKSF